MKGGWLALGCVLLFVSPPAGVTLILIWFGWLFVQCADLDWRRREAEYLQKYHDFSPEFRRYMEEKMKAEKEAEEKKK